MFISKLQSKDKGKRYSAEEKFEVVMRIVSGVSTIEEIAKERSIAKKSISNWKKEFFQKAHSIFEEDKSQKDKPDKTETVINRQQKEIQLLKKLLEHYRRTRDKQSSISHDSS